MEMWMTSDALLAYFHFASMIGLASLLVAELALLAQPASAGRPTQLRSLDGLYSKVISLQLALVALIPFAATLMARGIGAG